MIISQIELTASVMEGVAIALAGEIKPLNII